MRVLASHCHVSRQIARFINEDDEGKQCEECGSYDTTEERGKKSSIRWYEFKCNECGHYDSWDNI